MKEYNSNYLGMVIDNNDPEYRGRVQVFIPHIMPALYEGWNQEGKDIQISCVGSNMESSLGDDIVNRLKLILPWAEAASPIIGPSAPGGVVSSGGAGGGSNQFVQSPTSSPTEPLGPGDGSLASTALNNVGWSSINCPERGNKGCACTVSEMFQRAYPGQDMFTGVKRTDSTTAMLNGMKSSPNLWQEIPYDQQQAGDIIVTGSAAKSGHVGINVDGYKIASNSSSRAQFEVNYNKDSWTKSIASRPGAPTSVFRYIGPGSPAAGGTPAAAQQPATAPSSSSAPQTASAASAVPPREVPVAAPDANPQTGAPSNGMSYSPGAGTVAGTTSGGGTTSDTGVSKEALEYAMRVAAAESGAGIQSSSDVLKEISDPMLALGYSYNSYVSGSEKISWTGSRSYEEVRALGRQIASRPGFNANAMDVGYTQNNNNDAARYGLKNSGSYRDQVLSLAQHVQNQMNDPNKAAFAAALRSGDFPGADRMNAVPGWNITEGNVNAVKYKRYTDAKASLSNKIDSEFGGDPFSALNAVDGENPATDSANTMLGTNYVSPVPGAGQSYAGAPSVIGNTYPHGRPHQMNTNDMANGLFAFPAVGAMVWVFFREGNPLYPVYFAASYSSSEWQRAYNGASLNSTGTNTGNPEPHKLSSRTAMNLGGGNSITNISQQDTQDQLNSYSALCVQHNSGSGLTFRDGVTEQYDKNDYFKQTDGNLWNVTHGAKETWISGPSNSNQIGNSTEFYGKWDQEAMEASKKLADMCFEYNQKMKSQK